MGWRWCGRVGGWVGGGVRGEDRYTVSNTTLSPPDKKNKTKKKLLH